MSEILRAVIDTNHVMSAILSDRGASSKLIDWMTKEENYFTLLISEPIRREYETVAGWLIPDSRRNEMRRILDILYDRAELVKPGIRLNACSDESDNCFLECAVTGNADYLVTKNIRDFPPKEYQGVRIVRIAKFLIVLEQMENTLKKLV
ncbi:MAG: putative toxin-antitoxin system toxin component, PIN family [Desulfobacteraceae bacterium IS3]|nr:MAG: putative toxin-antitoxin system toxin component, PIN family [Desulfobacteraceae bacterium IS3]